MLMDQELNNVRNYLYPYKGEYIYLNDFIKGMKDYFTVSQIKYENFDHVQTNLNSFGYQIEEETLLWRNKTNIWKIYYHLVLDSRVY